MKKIFRYILLLGLILFTACSTSAPPKVHVQVTSKEVDFLKDVKPILDKRCVVCHSCYNSPCQAKLSSYEGIDRGGSKLLVYDALRLSAVEPTRLFIDAKSTQEWQKRGFYSLTQNFDTNTSYHNSIMMHMIHDKKIHPEVIGEYRPEKDKLICPKNPKEMGEYLDEKPNHGMPYGLPALSKNEYNTLENWLAHGAKGPTKKEEFKLKSSSKAAQREIQKWENFLNQQDPKHSVTARYLYEHLFLAHWNFTVAPGEFYELVRSYTPAPEPINTIATVRPFDDPKVKKFYYRLQKIHSTIVHKTHMVVQFNDTKLQRIQDLFIHKKWQQEPHYIDYDIKSSANPFISFQQIPAKSRYQFLLNNSHYIVMTFIRGPVCRGQMALNVIHDHFWVMFADPDHDISIQNPNFLQEQADNLSMPIETTSQDILKTFSDDYRKKYLSYFNAKQELYLKQLKNGMSLDFVWKGDQAEDAPLLTVYRHFDSASVHKGIIGELPRTLWMIDYPQLERIYYSLVAGYDVFGNISHQTNIRRYMDFLRFEGELNFLVFMPKNVRKEMLFSWYKGDDMLEDIIDTKENIHIFSRKTAIDFKTIYPKNEFMEMLVNHHILKTTNIHFDNINYIKAWEKPPKMPTSFKTEKDVRAGAKSLTSPGTAFIKRFTDDAINTVNLRVILPNKENIVATIVINRWHDNVNSMFREDSTLDHNKDTIDFVPGSIGSYPNAFAVVHYKDLKDFFDLIENYDDSDEYILKIQKYFINRSHKDFWKTYDWFQEYLNRTKKEKAGLYDLNRYYYK